MAKNGIKNAVTSKKDKVQAKSGTPGIVKAKDKRKKPAAFKKNKAKLGEEIQSANTEFVELQTKMISEKETKEDDNDTLKEATATKVSVQPPSVTQEEQVEETINVLANL